MKERPILFSAPMILALFAGTKTQTRRKMKPQLDDDGRVRVNDGHAFIGNSTSGNRVTRVICPYGVPGDRLWVRESLYRRPSGSWFYSADDLYITLPHDHPGVPAMISWAHHKDGKHCPSIHMPRWASRLALEVTDVRVQRVQEISLDDARAEGIPQMHGEAVTLGLIRPYGPVPGNGPDSRDLWDNRTSVENFSGLWNSIHAKDGCGWDANPWVWAITFNVVNGGGR